jgi:phosphatidylserine/phosphatidylglycerophosphate/cardiolipin synthase-like enzyme
MTTPTPRQVAALFSHLRRQRRDTWNTGELPGLDQDSVSLAMRSMTILADKRDATETTVVPVVTSPRSARARRVNVVVDELLREARDEIVIVGYELSETRTMARLAERASLGVRVELLVDRVQTSTDALRAAWPRGAGDAHLYSSAIGEHGRPVRLHAKLLIVDVRRALVGSANFTRSGMRSNIEIGVLLEGSAVATLRSYAGDLIRRGLVEQQEDLTGGEL